MKPPKLKAPAGATDTHMHFYGKEGTQAPGTFLPGEKKFWEQAKKAPPE